jgi:hypothetical protein
LTGLDHNQIIKKLGGQLTKSYLDVGFILGQSGAVNVQYDSGDLTDSEGAASEVE